MAAVIARASLVGNDPSRNNDPSSSCALCGCKEVIVRCEKCEGFAFCFACDDIYHIHPKRKFHIRTSIEKPAPAAVSSHRLPKQPLNAKIVGQSPNPSKMPVAPPRRRRSLSVARPAEMAMSIKDKLGNFLRRHSSAAKAEAKAAAKVRSPSLGEQPSLFIERPASRVPAPEEPEEPPKAATLKPASVAQETSVVETKPDLRSATFTRSSVNGLPPVVQPKPVGLVPNGEELFWPRSNGRRASSSSGTKSDLSAVDYVPTLQEQRRTSQLSSNSSRKFSGQEFMPINNKAMPYNMMPPQAQFFGPPIASPQFGMPYMYNQPWSASIEELNRLNYQIRRPIETSTDDDDLALQERKAQSPRGRSSSRASRSNSLRRARSQSAFQSPMPQMVGPWAMMPPMPNGMPPPPPPQALQYGHMGYAAMPPYAMNGINGMNPYAHPYGPGVPESSASPRSSASSRRHHHVRAQSQESTGSSKLSKYRPSSRNNDHRRHERDGRAEKPRVRRSTSRTRHHQSSGSSGADSETPESDYRGGRAVDNDLDSDRNQDDSVCRPWSCPHCTYKNPGRVEVCEMCCKSSPRKLKHEKARELEKLRLDRRLNITEQEQQPQASTADKGKAKKKRPAANPSLDMNAVSDFPEELIREQMEIERELKRRRENELRVAKENAELERRQGAQGVI